MSATGTLVSVGTIAGIYALLALALNLKFGETGILDFGHVAFYLVGAYATALLVMGPPEEYDFQEFLFGLNLPTRIIELTGFELLGGVGWLIAIAVGVVSAAFLGLVVALPAIRLREDYLAIALLGVSVIVVRTVQTTTWLANGPDSLRGYPRPFSELVPLPAESFSAALLLGLVIFVVWATLLYLLARADILDELDGRSGRLANGALWVTTLGAGYWAVRSTRAAVSEAAERGVGHQSSLVIYRHLLVVCAAYGVVAMVASVVGLGSAVILLFLGVGSLATWAVAGIKVREHYVDYTRKSALAGLAIAVALYATLAPARVLGGEGLVAYVGSLITFVLIAVVAYGLYRAYVRWDRFDVSGDFIGISGIALLWMLAIRYFVISIIDARSVGSIIGSTIENVFWLVDFNVTLGPSLNYRRFLFVIVIGTVVASFVLLETLRKSPYGRVLRAIRDDENVAMSLGKNTFYYKVQAMVIGGGFAGLAGALGAVYYRSLGYTLFNPIVTFFIFLAVILGGRANNKGVILGAAFYWMLVRATSELAAMFPGPIGSRITILRNAIIGILLVLVLYYRPEGIWPEERTIVEVPER